MVLKFSFVLSISARMPGVIGAVPGSLSVVLEAKPCWRHMRNREDPGLYCPWEANAGSSYPQMWQTVHLHGFGLLHRERQPALCLLRRFPPPFQPLRWWCVLCSCTGKPRETTAFPDAGLPVIPLTKSAGCYWTNWLVSVRPPIRKFDPRACRNRLCL